MAYKIEELKYRNLQLKKQIEVKTTPVPITQHAAQEEIESLRIELSNLKTSNGEVLSILREMLIATVGPGAIDIPYIETNKVLINISSYQIQISTLKQTSSRLREQCSSLVHEVYYMQALVNRLVLWRADLKYQKLYLSLKVEDLLARFASDLNLI